MKVIKTYNDDIYLIGTSDKARCNAPGTSCATIESEARSSGARRPVRFVFALFGDSVRLRQR